MPDIVRAVRLPNVNAQCPVVERPVRDIGAIWSSQGAAA
jgi:hypothetical protein